MNINTIFARVTSAFNTQMDAHLRAIAEGKQTATEAPTDRGVVLYANVANEGTLKYVIRSYRIRGQNECTLPATERLRVKLLVSSTWPPQHTATRWKASQPLATSTPYTTCRKAQSSHPPTNRRPPARQPPIVGRPQP
jgi:hypothetical protein